MSATDPSVLRSTGVRRELAPSGPIGRLDRAFTLVRAGGLARAAGAWSAGAPLALVIVGLYYVERVEGVRALRLPFALALALAWWWRAWKLGTVARDHVLALWDGAPLPEGAGAPAATLRTAMWTGLGMWCWSWLLVLGALAGPLGVLAVVPLFALRGAIAPSWIGRAACSEDAGLRLVRGAIGDSDGQRAEGLVAELALLLGGLALFVDLWLAIAALLMLGRSLLGLELALLDAFLSWRNTFVLLVVAMSALVLLEPIRAALSAVTWVEARVRAEGLDLRIAVEDAIARAGVKQRDRVAATIVIAMLAASSSAHAQPPPAFPPPPPPDAAAATASTEPFPDTPFVAIESPSDTAALTEADRILSRPEFREFADTDGRGIRQLLERLIEWLFRHRDPIEAPEAPVVPTFALPGPIVFLVGAVLVLAAFIALLVLTRPSLRRAARPGAEAVGDPVAIDPRERAPDQWIDDAARLAAQGLFREALRALYLATLVALDRRRLIRFDPTLTNGQYLRQMPEGDARRGFRELSRIFDHKHYGREETLEHDYRAARALAEAIVGPDRPAGGLPGEGDPERGR